MTDQEFQERVLARIDSMQEDISWIRGNLEGKQEAAAAFYGKIATLIAVWSTIISILVCFK